MSIENKVNKYKEILDILPTPQEKYEYLVDQAKKMRDFPEELRLDEFKVPGCQSQVWLVPEEKDNYLNFLCDSDALIAKGLVYIITEIYSGALVITFNNLLNKSSILLGYSVFVICFSS